MSMKQIDKNTHFSINVLSASKIVISAKERGVYLIKLQTIKMNSKREWKLY